MSDGVPKSRVTLTYDTKQPAGREKPRELPFRLLVLGNVGGDKSAPLEQRKVRQLNGRNLGEVIKGLKIKVEDIDLGAERKTSVLIDSIASFSPDDVLRLLTGQKASAPPSSAFEPRQVSGSAKLIPMLRSSWGENASAESLWPGDEVLTRRWAEREKVVHFQKLYQNTKLLRTALKRFSAPPAENDVVEQQARKEAIATLKAHGVDAAKAKALADDAKKKDREALKAEKQSADAALVVTAATANHTKLDAAAKAATPKDPAATKAADDAKKELDTATTKATALAAAAKAARNLAIEANLAKLQHVEATAKARLAAADQALADATKKATALGTASTSNPTDAAAKKLADDATQEVTNATARRKPLADAADKATKDVTDAPKVVP